MTEADAIGVCCTDGQRCTTGRIRDPPPDIEILNSLRHPNEAGDFMVYQTLRVTNLTRYEIELSCCNITNNASTGNVTCEQTESHQFQILDTPSDDELGRGNNITLNFS